MPLEQPFALVEKGPRGLAVTAVNACAHAAGVRPGQPLADVRAALPGLAVHPAATARDATALVGLARWLGRYGPGHNIDGADTAWVDITGAAHLFGGEAALLAGLVDRLARLGITARAGLADTHGAAHALARFRTSPSAPWTLAPAQDTTPALAPLPVAALRLDQETVRLLDRLGLKRIGSLYGLPRAALERRFRAPPGPGGGSRRTAAARGLHSAEAAAVLMRLDQALGRLAEPRAGLAPPPDSLVRLAFAEPLISAAGIAAALAHLARDLATGLAAAGQGARAFRLALYRTDATVAQVAIATSVPCRDAGHICRLLAPRLDDLDAGLGIDLATLEADRLEPLAATQAGLADDTDTAARTDLLVDRLAGRLGAACVLRLAPGASHIPERSQTARPALAGVVPMLPAVSRSARAAVASPPRPPLLLARPEPVDVVAEVPDGAPARLVWRRLARRIVRTEGPERIAPEWWRAPGLDPEELPGIRDYYRLEDTSGAGYWVFRDGLYAADAGPPPRWLLHGLWA